MRFPRWPLPVYSIEVRKLLSYRADFWIQFSGALAGNIIISFALWKSIFLTSNQMTIGGYTFETMMLYYVIAALVDKCIRGNEMGNLSPDIYDGTFTRYLVYPLSSIGYKYMNHLAVSTMGIIQFFVGFAVCLLFIKIPHDSHMGLASLAMGFITIVFSGALYFILNCCLELVSFWADNVWSLLVILRLSASILGGSWIPLTLFPPWAQHLIHYSPFPYLASFPIRVFLGEIDGQLWIQGLISTLLWCMGGFVVSQIIMKKGLLKYTGVGI